MPSWVLILRNLEGKEGARSVFSWPELDSAHQPIPEEHQERGMGGRMMSKRKVLSSLLGLPALYFE